MISSTIFSITIIIVELSMYNGDTVIEGDINLFGQGICPIHRVTQKVVPVTKLYFRNKYKWEFCWKFPPICDAFYRIVYEYGKENQNIPLEHLVLKCCPGWQTNEKKTQCLPACSVHCLPESCVGPNNCTNCKSGFMGKMCKSSNANDTCNCPNDNFVCSLNGTESVCICSPGFTGVNCDVIAEADSFITDHEVKLSCTSASLQVSFLISLLLLSLFILIFVVRRYCGVPFEPLINDDNVSSLPSTSNIQEYA